MIDPERSLLIANPAAAGGRVGREWAELLPRLREALGAPVRAALTERPGHALELARQAAAEQGMSTLLSLGGDGTHGEVAGGMVAAQAPPGSLRLGVIHAGTGGDFRRLLAPAEGPAGYARNLREAGASPIDLGLARWTDAQGREQERVFLNEVSTGMSAMVTTFVNESSKRLGGKLTFLGSTLRALLAYRPAVLRITVDGQELEPRRVATAMIANGQFAGGSMHFAPRARLDDGALDIVIIRQANPLRMLRLSPQLYNGRLLESDLVEMVRGRRLEIHTESGQNPDIEADGETLGPLPLQVELLPGAIQLIGAPAMRGRV